MSWWNVPPMRAMATSWWRWSTTWKPRSNASSPNRAIAYDCSRPILRWRRFLCRALRSRFRARCWRFFADIRVDGEGPVLSKMRPGHHGWVSTRSSPQNGVSIDYNQCAGFETDPYRNNHGGQEHAEVNYPGQRAGCVDCFLRHRTESCNGPVQQ